MILGKTRVFNLFVLVIGWCCLAFTPVFATDPVNINNKTGYVIEVTIEYSLCNTDYLTIQPYSDNTVGTHRGWCLVSKIYISNHAGEIPTVDYDPPVATAYVHFEVVLEDGELVVQHVSETAP